MQGLLPAATEVEEKKLVLRRRGCDGQAFPSFCLLRYLPLGCSGIGFPRQNVQRLYSLYSHCVYVHCIIFRHVVSKTPLSQSRYALCVHCLRHHAPPSAQPRCVDAVLGAHVCDRYDRW